MEYLKKTVVIVEREWETKLKDAEKLVVRIKMHL